MRIVGGKARGRPLFGPKPTSKEIRPTSDRVRETLFNLLGQTLDGPLVLDLYAGTGALGLEAVSRGARSAVLVDQGREAQGLCRRNTEALGMTGQVELLAMPVDRALEHLSRRGAKFELVFADPPYAARVGSSLLERLDALGLLVPQALFVLEHDKREEPPERQGGFFREDSRRFGDTVVSLYRWAPPVA